jgi:hypothetical protein
MRSLTSCSCAPDPSCCTAQQNRGPAQRDVVGDVGGRVEIAVRCARGADDTVATLGRFGLDLAVGDVVSVAVRFGVLRDGVGSVDGVVGDGDGWIVGAFGV